MTTRRRSSSEKVRRAARAATAVRPWSGYIQHAAEFDEEKIASLHEILAGIGLTGDRASGLIERAQRAVIDFHMSPETRPSVDVEKLERLENAAMELEHAWSDLSPDMRQTLLYHLQGRGPTADLRPPISQAVELWEQARRVERVLHEDLPAIRHAAGEVSEIVVGKEPGKRSGPQKTKEHLLVFELCRAWINATGGCPTLSRNEIVQLGTPFERFADAALLPEKIGSGVLRSVVDSFKAPD